MAITQVTLTAAITSTQTTVPVSAVTNITAPNNQTGSGITYLQVDQELMLVAGAPVGLVVPVVRGYNSTASVAHTNGSLVAVGLPGDFQYSNETVQQQVATQVTGASYNQPGINLTGSADAISPAVPGFYVVKTAGVDAMTLAAPPASAEGNIIEIVSDTTNAHTLTATTLLANGTALKTTATFPAFRGAYLKLRACNGVWEVLSNGASAGVVVLT